MARIFQSSLMGEADVRVCIVPNKEQADLLVHRVNAWSLALGDHLWYITKDKQAATCRIFLTSQGMAQVYVCFVATYGEAGWQKPHKLRGRLG